MADYVELYWEASTGDMRIRFMLTDIPAAEGHEAVVQLERAIDLWHRIDSDHKAAVEASF